MNQDKFQASSGGQSQSDRILAELAAHVGEWVPMPRLARIGARSENGFCMVHSRISDLNRRRRKKGLPVIEQHSEHRNGACLSFYRLPAAAGDSRAPSDLRPPTSDLPSSVPLPPTSEVSPAQVPEVSSNHSPSPCGTVATGLLTEPSPLPAGEGRGEGERPQRASALHDGELFPLEETRPAREAFA